VNKSDYAHHNLRRPCTSATSVLGDLSNQPWVVLIALLASMNTISSCGIGIGPMTMYSPSR
jgi:hypothetical protein